MGDAGRPGAGEAASSGGVGEVQGGGEGGAHVPGAGTGRAARRRAEGAGGVERGLQEACGDGRRFVVVALTPYGGWHKEAKEWTDRVAHTGDKVPHDAWDERFEHPARTWASASHRAFTLQATGVAMANATYKYMRENSRFEMMRAVGAKAVASVEMAVPPTMVAGELSVESSEGETSGEDYRDGDYSDIDD